MKTAVITGASSGLGREFARQIARREQPEEIWVIARRRNRLEEIGREIPIPVRVIPLDLTEPASMREIRSLLEREKPDIRILVNAAGFGRMGSCSEIPAQDSNDMIDLNCKALVDMTALCLPYMKKGARILEISSAASFQPLPALNVYASTKAFVTSYSRALRWELFGRGIRVTAVCPYWISDTEFISVAKRTSGPRAIRHFPLASRTGSVVSLALFGSRLNLPVTTPGLISLMMRFFTKFIPREIIIPIWEVLRRI